jgi:hypothetical protein
MGQRIATLLSVNVGLPRDPQPLEPPAEGNVLLCCSRPDGDVVLDL